MDNAVKKSAEYAPNALIVIRSAVSVGYVADIRVSCGRDNIIFLPKFFREGKALFDSKLLIIT